MQQTRREVKNLGKVFVDVTQSGMYNIYSYTTFLICAMPMYII